MKQFTITLLFLCAASLSVSAQPVVSYDPCGELRVALFTADKLISQGKLDEALAKLNKFKNDPEMRNCDEMKEGMVDFKINDVKKRIEKRNAPLTIYKSCPDGSHPHLIDLGLPSGTKWACCNVDALKPEDYGGYYAWGETTTQQSVEYSWMTYKHCDGHPDSCRDLGSSICGTQYDVAHVKWGSSWQLPTKEQIDELLKKCKDEWTTQNGVEGRKFTGPNGASIFLPAAGACSHSLIGAGSLGEYWTGTQDTEHEYEACDLTSGKGNLFCSRMGRSCGESVRPVSK